jgi:isopenicillin N synthase-like dioxygenase
MFKSTVHRVVSTSGTERFSCPFFFEPNFDAVVSCLPSCSKHEPPRYPTTTAGEHLLAKYRETHALFEESDDS